MAEHVLTLTLTDEALERIKAAAAGLTPEAYVMSILDRALASSASEVSAPDAAFIVDEAPAPWPPVQPYDTTESERRLAEYDRTGEYIEFDEWAAGFEAELEVMLKARA